MTLSFSSWSIRKRAALLVGGVLIVVLAVGSLGYGLPRENRTGTFLRSFLPLPMAIMDGRAVVTSRELASNLSSVRRFYETQDFSQVGIRVDFSTEEGKKRLALREKEIFNKMIEDTALEAIARDRGVSLSHEAVESGLKRKLEEFGGEMKVRENLGRLYGWSLDEFQEKVVRPAMLEERIKEVALREIDTKPARERIEKAKGALATKTPFSDVVSQYSEGRTAGSGGDLGWFFIEDISPELRGPVSLQKKGIPGDILESELGYHIIVVEEIKEEQGKKAYHLRQIFAKKETFADWLTEEMRKHTTRIFSRDYTWNQEKSEIEFRREDLRAFERESLKNAGDNIPFLF